MRALPVVLVMALPAAAQAKAVAEFRPMHLFGDHMVLPAATPVPIVGFGPAGGEVAVRGSWGASGTTRTDDAGHWRCELPTPARGGPFEVTMRCQATAVTLHDVLIGDVFLCSGQSNMVMPVGPGHGMGGVRNWQHEVAAAAHPTLRVFTVHTVASATPAGDIEGEWQVCSPATASSFSASAYFFGAELLQHGQAPIGLVVSAWGGTVCEAWTSANGLRELPEFGDEIAALTSPTQKATHAQRLAAFWAAVDERAIDGPATTVAVPELWSTIELRSFDGVATYERHVTLPSQLRGAPLVLTLGALDDMDTVWWNGARIGGHERAGAWQAPRRYEVPATAVPSVALRVRIVDTGGEGGWTGAPDDVCLALASDSSVRLPLAGSWSRQRGPALRALPAWPDDDDAGPNRPTVLWNGMIAPLAPFPFAGVLWYQGESNRGRADQYARLFPAMIQDWRAAFGRALPFWFVQIAPFGYDDDEGNQAAQLREAQAAALALPATGMVVTLDCGDADDIHPIDKQPVGQRLAKLALARHYGQPVACEGPRFLHVVRHAERGLRLTFAASGRALVLEPGGRGFELAGEDGVFVAAAATIEGDHVDLQAPTVPRPVHVRYAWAAVPHWSLRDDAGMLAPPFRATLR